jgi:hypothetical protein
MYVPGALAPLIRRALHSGRRIEQAHSGMDTALPRQHHRNRVLAAHYHLKPAKRLRAKYQRH